MSEFTNQLKARADVGQLIGEVVALKPGGNGFIGLCPFHSEKTPSFHVHTAKRFYYCFGCHAHGDIFQFYMQLRQISFNEAVELLAERLGVELPSASGPNGNDPLRRELHAIHAAAGEYYQQMLAGREGAEAQAYLRSRDFAPAAVAGFQVGYAPDSGRGLALHLQAQRFPARLALRAGLCQLRRESSERPGAASSNPEDAAWSDLYDRFRHRLMFPIADERGQIIAFGGRTLATDGKAPKYLNSPEHPLYTKGKVLYNLDRARAAIRQLGYGILVEGYFDCLRVALAGFENVVASCGTALTPAQLAVLGRLTKKVAVNFDPDTAGEAAAERSIGLLLEEGFQMRVVMLDAGMDPDVFIRRQGREAYGVALKRSRSFFDYLADRVRGRYDLQRGEGKLSAINELLPFLSHVHEPILRQTLAENLAAQLGIDQPLVSRELLQAARQRKREMASTAATAAPESLYAERVLLRAWLEWEPRRAEIQTWVAEEGLLAGLATEPLLGTLMQAPPAGDWQALTGALEPDQQRWLAQVLLNADNRGAQDPPLSEDDLQAAVEALRQRRGAAVRKGLQAQIQQAAAAGDRERLQALLREKTASDAALRPPRPRSG